MSDHLGRGKRILGSVAQVSRNFCAAVPVKRQDRPKWKTAAADSAIENARIG